MPDKEHDDAHRSAKDEDKHGVDGCLVSGSEDRDFRCFGEHPDHREQQEPNE